MADPPTKFTDRQRAAADWLIEAISSGDLQPNGVSQDLERAITLWLADISYIIGEGREEMVAYFRRKGMHTVR